MSSKLDSRKLRLGAFLAVMGPGIIAGLSDDDPAGITTYSQLGAQFGYQLLWTLGISTIALILFQDLGARIGVVTRQGLIGLVRQKYGARSGMLSALALVLANIGTMTAEFAGIAAAGNLFGISKYITVPLAGIVVSFLVLRGSFARARHGVGNVMKFKIKKYFETARHQCFHQGGPRRSEQFLAYLYPAQLGIQSPGHGLRGSGVRIIQRDNYR